MYTSTALVDEPPVVSLQCKHCLLDPLMVLKDSSCNMASHHTSSLGPYPYTYIRAIIVKYACATCCTSAASKFDADKYFPVSLPLSMAPSSWPNKPVVTVRDYSTACALLSVVTFLSSHFSKRYKCSFGDSSDPIHGPMARAA